MPKHIPTEHYFGSPYELSAKVNIHPEIEHHDHPSDTEHYLLPAVFHFDKEAAAVTAKYPGPGVYYITEGQGQYENVEKPGSPTAVSAGAVVHVEEGSVLRWSSLSGAKGFAVFWVPVSIKGFDAFIVPE